MIKLKSATSRKRLYWLDLFRAGLILSMISYHFYWDLVYFQIINESSQQAYLSRSFAHTIAAGFLFISGFSILIASKGKSFLKKFLWRFTKILAAALAISCVTYLVFPQNFIYFGILHEIAFASLLVAALLPTSYVVDFLVTLIILFIAYALHNKNLPNSIWTYLTLTKNVRPSLDFVPLVPWAAFATLGSGSAKLYLLKIKSYGHSLSNNDHYGDQIVNLLSKYSLLIYLLHQPILFGALYFNNNLIHGQTKNDFIQNCVVKCVEKNNQAICMNYCKCMKYKLADSTTLPLEQNAQFCAKHTSQ